MKRTVIGLALLSSLPALPALAQTAPAAPTLTEAQRIGALEARIAALEAELRALRAGAATPAVTVVGSTPVVTANIGAPAGAQRVAEAELQKDDASCAATLDAAASQALSGTVTVSASDTEFIDGTFDLLMPAGEHLTGQFHAAICAEPTHKPLPTCRVE